MKEGEAAAITRASKSNLAFAFLSMSGQRRRDITTFYAFCRLVDDAADDPGKAVEQRRHELQRWRAALHERVADEPALAAPVRQLVRRYPGITPAMLEEIIDGVEMDLTPRCYATWEELRVYCYRVASAVGLVSIEIFGYKNPKCREYAVALGLALQLTNIIRDVGTDLAQDRIYLPMDDLEAANYRLEDLRARVTDERFVGLMKIQAARAGTFFMESANLLPFEDRRRMLPAEIMRSIYQSLLRQMSRDDFHVLTTKYRLNNWQKAGHAVTQMIKFA